MEMHLHNFEQTIEIKYLCGISTIVGVLWKWYSFQLMCLLASDYFNVKRFFHCLSYAKTTLKVLISICLPLFLSHIWLNWKCNGKILNKPYRFNIYVELAQFFGVLWKWYTLVASDYVNVSRLFSSLILSSYVKASLKVQISICLLLFLSNIWLKWKCIDKILK